METQMNRLLQSEQSDRTPCHVVCIEDRERTYYSLRVKYLTDYCPGFFILRFADEYRLATQVMQRRGLVNGARLFASPGCLAEVGEEISPAASPGRRAEDPGILERLPGLGGSGRRRDTR